MNINGAGVILNLNNDTVAVVTVSCKSRNWSNYSHQKNFVIAGRAT